MTNEELFTDLKQFIEATVSQQTAHLDGRINGLEKRISDVQQHLSSHIDTLDEKVDVVQDHEHRLHRLERKAA